MSFLIGPGVGPAGPAYESLPAGQTADNPWFSWQYVQDNADTIVTALREHVSLTASAVLIAALIAIPLAVVAYWFHRLTGPILALSGTLYTIPSLALFAFLGPLVGTGPGTVRIGLVIYALLLIVRNVLAGLNKVPADVRDAAEGMGYGRFLRLVRIELPLALPGIMTGLRLATVSTVALTTVGILIGHGGLGQLMIDGFQHNYYKAEIVTGAVLTVVLALVLDLLLAGAGRLIAPWTRRRTA
jgi:osmoprotectant transport system permease protein